MATPVKLIKVMKTVPSVIPSAKIKMEYIEEEDMGISCRLCSKEFFNEHAIRNHLRMEHSGVEVDLQEWVSTAGQSRVKVKPDPDEAALTARRRAALLSEMAPADMTALASPDVSYIIINAEEARQADDAGGRASRKKKSDEEGGGKQKAPRRERAGDKEVTPITGPFECLQPSTLVAEGTCHQIFFSCCDYSMHFRDEHTRRRKAIKCQVCEKLLASDVGDDSPFPCQVCGAGFHSNKHLAEHTSTAHVKLKPFECGVCHKRFTQQGGVQQHMRMHTGDRPFPCTYCGKSFTQKSGLDQHLRTHTKIKPYRCVICGKTFVQSVHLKQHMRTHTNVSPFQCAICDKRFKQSSHLNYHLKNHNEANMTDDQKRKYQELIGMIDEHTRAQFLQAAAGEGAGEGEEAGEQHEAEEGGEEHEGEGEEQEEGEGEEHEGEGYEQEGEGEEQEEGYEQEEEMLETIIIEEAEGSSMDGSEQIVLQDDREYILADTGEETWSVRLQ